MYKIFNGLVNNYKVFIVTAQTAFYKKLFVQ